MSYNNNSQAYLSLINFSSKDSPNENLINHLINPNSNQAILESPNPYKRLFRFHQSPRDRFWFLLFLPTNHLFLLGISEREAEDKKICK